MATLGAVAVVVVGAWFVLGLFLAVVHIIELLAVAIAAGWAGYRIGLYRGRRLRG
jgi:hypothetical protein